MRPPAPGIHTLAAPYVLHALPPDEIPSFETHLRACAACRDEVADLREAVARLGSTVAVTPPPDLKARVLREITEVRPLPPPPADETATSRRSRRSRSRRSRRAGWAATMLVAALAAVLAVLTVGVSDAQDDLDREQAGLALVERIVTSADAERSTLAGGDAVVIASRTADAVVVLGSGLPPAPEGRDYQVWLSGSDRTVSAGLLRPGAESEPVVATGIGAARQVTVTLEPSGGSAQPSGEPLMVADLPS
ncbi:anti-sigma factor [Jiangella alkaliphila]|uniref:Regulator of SigK n=1 Tax=Jiangella alkaliphila TaxID=419479 RepID=A0A1H2L869_9ACTN|nr:anti-sigma factor [Jiangella alkaliphila]SDU76781.1 Anti-sigma-K factor RskA [Jiangella alkaliphila]